MTSACILRWWGNWPEPSTLVIQPVTPVCRWIDGMVGLSRIIDVLLWIEIINCNRNLRCLIICDLWECLQRNSTLNSPLSNSTLDQWRRDAIQSYTIQSWAFPSTPTSKSWTLIKSDWWLRNPYFGCWWGSEHVSPPGEIHIAIN